MQVHKFTLRDADDSPDERATPAVAADQRLVIKMDDPYCAHSVDALPSVILVRIKSLE